MSLVSQWILEMWLGAKEQYPDLEYETFKQAGFRVLERHNGTVTIEQMATELDKELKELA